MSNQRFSPEFKDEAVRQIVDRWYSVAEDSQRLVVSAHSLYKWVKAVNPDSTDEQAVALIEMRNNRERTHQGKMCCGRTLWDTLVDGKQTWQEKYVT